MIGCIPLLIETSSLWTSAVVYCVLTTFRAASPTVRHHKSRVLDAFIHLCPIFAMRGFIHALSWNWHDPNEMKLARDIAWCSETLSKNSQKIVTVAKKVKEAIVESACKVKNLWYFFFVMVAHAGVWLWSLSSLLSLFLLIREIHRFLRRERVKVRLVASACLVTWLSIIGVELINLCTNLSHYLRSISQLSTLSDLKPWKFYISLENETIMCILT